MLITTTVAANPVILSKRDLFVENGRKRNLQRILSQDELQRKRQSNTLEQIDEEVSFTLNNKKMIYRT